MPAFTGARLDRASKLRADPDLMRSLLAAPEARAVFCRGDSVLVADGGARLWRGPVPARAAAAAEAGPTLPLLGLEDGAPLFGVDLDELPEAPDMEKLGRIVTLREAGLALPPAEGGLAAYLIALSGWHRHHRFCANCGTPTAVVEGGLSRRCPRCGRAHFPRTDPVVIMLVEHDGRLLLGRRPVWPAERYSLLAGFVAPGETPEDAVVREVWEESGILAEHPQYVAAQPWPFPASLMLGFSAVSGGGDPRPADGELEDVRWFGRAQVAAACRREADWSDEAPAPGQLLLPPAVSVARSLIEWWLTDSTVDGRELTPDRPG